MAKSLLLDDMDSIRELFALKVSVDNLEQERFLKMISVRMFAVGFLD
jgi:hypothetical protein